LHRTVPSRGDSTAFCRREDTTPCPSVLVPREEPFPLADSSGIDRLELANRSLAIGLQGDLNATTAQHPLRVPWTVERAKGPPYVASIEIWEPNRRIRIEDVPVPPIARAIRPSGYGHREIRAGIRLAMGGKGGRPSVSPLVEPPVTTYVEGFYKGRANTRAHARGGRGA